MLATDRVGTLSGAMLLRHLDEDAAADAVDVAVADLVRAGDTLTYDMRSEDDTRPPASTSQVAEALAGGLST